MKAKLSQFRITAYAPGSRPCLRTLRRRIEQGRLPGGLKDADGHYYVDMDVYHGNRVMQDTLDELLSDPDVAEAVR